MTTDELFARFVVPSYARFPIKLERGSGSRVWDEDGREYLDFGAGIAVCSLGHSHPRIAETLAEQARRLTHVSNLYYHRLQGELARRLVSLTGEAGRIFFCNSGGEANECLYKLARRYGALSAEERFEIVTLEGSFHGRTLAGIAATGQAKVKKNFGEPVAGFRHVPPNDPDALRSAVSEKTAAVLIEPVLGEGGIHLQSRSYLEACREICDRSGALLFFDEVQCGLGRTGDMCGWRSIAPDVVPDGISWAKGIAGGFPFGASWISDKKIQLTSGERPLSELLDPGSHATTYGGNPLGCAVAFAVLDEIEEKQLLENVRKQANLLQELLRKESLPFVREIRGIGLMIGIEVTEPALEMVCRLHEKGLLAVPAGSNVIRFLPPLNVSAQEVEEAVKRFASLLE